MFLSVGHINRALGGFSVAGEDELRRADGKTLYRAAAGFVGGDARDGLIGDRPLVVGSDGHREVRACERYLVPDVDQELGALLPAVVDAERGYLRRGRGSRGRRGCRRRDGGDLRRRGRHGRGVGIVRIIEADGYHDNERGDDRDDQNYAEYELPFAVVGGSLVCGGTFDGAGRCARSAAAVLNPAGAALGAAAA